MVGIRDTFTKASLVAVLAASISFGPAYAMTFKVMYHFAGNLDGSVPGGEVLRDASGNLYGTTFQGGSPNLGTVYRLTPGKGEIVLHAFAGGSDGANPAGGLVADSAGNLYGTTSHGGSGSCSVCGTIFKICPRHGKIWRQHEAVRSRLRHGVRDFELTSDRDSHEAS